LNRSFCLPALLSVSVGLMVHSADSCLASAYKVTPVQVALSREKPSALLTLKNESEEVLRFQVSVFAWDQGPMGEIHVAPTKDIVLFPTLLSVAAGEERKLRIASLIPFGPVEKTYRIFFDELPPFEKAGSEFHRSQLRVLARMSIPIFLGPEKGVPAIGLDATELEDGRLSFSVRNLGGVHTRLQEVRIKGVGAVGEALFQGRDEGWYLLAGGSRRYAFEIPKESCREIKTFAIEVRTDHQTLSENYEAPPNACGP
jgi:fimbrial chaperone protein